MKKGFYDRVVREGMVDTYSYRYRTKQGEDHLIIERIRRKELGKIDEDDMWLEMCWIPNDDKV